MNRLLVTSAALSCALAACGSYEKNEAVYHNQGGAYAQGEANYSAGNAAAGNYAGGTGTTTTTAVEWPQGARIVVDNGVTYRIDPGGVRVALGPNDSKIVVENGVRYRVDPSGTRVRIDPSGAVIEVNTSG